MITDYKDGVPVYDEDIVYFDDWRKMEGHITKDELICKMVSDGATEEEIDEVWQGVIDEFYEWCEENELQGEEC